MPWSVLKVLRTNPDLMRENLKKRFMDPALVDEFLKVDSEWRRVQTELNRLRHEHNVISSQIAKAPADRRGELIAKAKELLEEIGRLEAKLKELEKRRLEILDNMPSLLHESVPIGPDDSYNAVVRVWGKALVQRKHLETFLAETEGKGVKMEYEVTDRELVGHADMLEYVLKLGDTLKAGEVAGSRFYYLFNDIVWLDMALLSYAIDYLTSKGFTLVPQRQVYAGR